MSNPSVKSLKRLAWFIFKSPQRKRLGWGTLFTDFVGLVAVAFQFFMKKKPPVIWICVGNKNRSEALLKHLISSLSQCNDAHLLALSVADCGSTDVNNLKEEISKIWKGPLVFHTMDEAFQRSRCFNRAINQAKGEYFFVCDVDVELPKNLVQLVGRYVTHKTSWFPICQWQLNADQKEWKWFTAGTGLFASTKSQMAKTGMYNEEFVAWGKEDWDLFFRFYQKGMMPLRTRTPNLYHHWHPSSKPADYENMF